LSVFCARKSGYAFNALKRTSHRQQIFINHAKNASEVPAVFAQETGSRDVFVVFQDLRYVSRIQNSGTYGHVRESPQIQGNASNSFRLTCLMTRILNNYVISSSSLWDLVKGLYDQLKLPRGTWRAMDRQGIVEVHASIHKLLLNATVYWRTSPPPSHVRQLTSQRWSHLANQEVECSPFNQSLKQFWELSWTGGRSQNAFPKKKYAGNS
jgi:hypothetical protein